MRGRKPRPVTLAAEDRPILRAIARSRRLPWLQVQHARIVLAVAAGEPIQAVAYRMECDPATVWRICRRYEQGGLQKLLVEAPRLGRPRATAQRRPSDGDGVLRAHHNGTPNQPLGRVEFGTT
jgi:hypothetical protein